jgi:hypothetical protein
MRPNLTPVVVGGCQKGGKTFAELRSRDIRFCLRWVRPPLRGQMLMIPA